jgi:hypothetical protein
MRSALLPKLMAFALDRRCTLAVRGRVCLVNGYGFILLTPEQIIPQTHPFRGAIEVDFRGYRPVPHCTYQPPPQTELFGWWRSFSALSSPSLALNSSTSDKSLISLSCSSTGMARSLQRKFENLNLRLYSIDI